MFFVIIIYVSGRDHFDAYIHDNCYRAGLIPEKYWIGLARRDMSPSWKWESNTPIPVTYTNWNSDNIELAYHECAVAGGTGDKSHTWHSVTCYETFGVLCSKPAQGEWRISDC